MRMRWLWLVLLLVVGCRESSAPTPPNPWSWGGRWWHGYYFKTQEEARVFANKYYLSTCQYDEVVLGASPGKLFRGIPHARCRENLQERIDFVTSHICTEWMSFEPYHAMTTKCRGFGMDESIDGKHRRCCHAFEE